ncbi:MAG TPA: hypothetical protein VFG20_02955 [Planctomycetaceae bacterium]|nr:hypothetical protein [Planctomycetaceae bacterium]
MEPHDSIASSSDRPTESASGDRLSDRGYRLDGPHRDFSASEPVPRPARRDMVSDLMAQLLQLQADVAQQDDREAAFAEREQRLHAERAEFERWRTEQRQVQDATEARLSLREQALLEGEERLVTQEETLSERAAEIDATWANLQREQAALDESRNAIEKEFAALQQDRASLSAQLQSELAADREAILQAQLVLEERALALDDADTQARARNDALLQQERQGLWQTLSLEWQQRHAAFESERNQWEAQCAQIQTLLEEQRTACQQAFDQLDAELAARRDAADAELAERQAAVEEEIAAARQHWEQTQATAAADLQRDRGVLESRLRFQQEHLEKTRIDLERLQLDFRKERQQERHRLEELDQQSRRRLVQLALYRDALGEQAKSLDREAATFQKVRRAWDDSVATSRALFEAEQSQWKQDAERQRIEITRQQDALSKLSENIEGRRQRLEKLRLELEETHRNNLELRLAVEEAWAQIAQALGSDEEARLRVEQARQGLSLYYQELHAGLMAQRRELIDLEHRLQHERGEFHAERQTLVQWLNERDTALQSREADIAGQLQQTLQEQSTWRTLQQHWMSQRLEAESVIRRLLGELGERHNADVARPWDVASTMSDDGEPEGDVPFEIPARVFTALSDAPPQSHAA